MAIVGVALSLAVSTVAGIGLVRQSPGHWTSRAANAYVEPACDIRLEGRLEVCLHPEDKALLVETADEVERLLAPVAGLNGVPIRYENQPASVVFSDPERAYIGVRDGQDIPTWLGQSVMHAVFESERSGDMSYAYGAAKYVVASWLLERADVDLSQEAQGIYMYRQPLPRVYAYEQAIREGATDSEALLEGASDVPFSELADFERDVNAAVDRFAALSPEDQRAWLEVNWDALMHGRLTLDALP